MSLYTQFAVEHTFSLFILNIVIYMLLTYSFLSLVLCFDLRKFKSLNDFRNLGSSNFFLISGLLILLSFAGLPPIMGFLGKFLFIMYFINCGKFYLAVTYAVVNMFVLFFYIQNVRFMVKRSLSNCTNIRGFFSSISFSVVFNIVFINFFNFFGLFFVGSFLTVFYYWASLSLLG